MGISGNGGRAACPDQAMAVPWPTGMCTISVRPAGMGAIFALGTALSLVTRTGL